MAKKDEIVFSILENLKDHTDDSLISERHIEFKVNSYRSMLLRQLYSDRSKGYDQAAIQTFCMDMQRTDPGLCGIDTGCTIIRSVKKIPSLLSVKGRSTLTRVGPPIIGLEGYEITNQESVSHVMADKFATNSAFIMDDYLYVVGNTPAFKLIKCVSVSGLFETPEELYDLQSCDSCGTKKVDACYSEEHDYPIPGHLIVAIIDAITNLYKGVELLENRRDKDNNSVPE